MTKSSSWYLIAKKRAFLSTWRGTLRRLHQSYFFLVSDYFDICSAANPITPRHKEPLSAFPQLSTLHLCGKLWFCMISSRSGCWYLTPCPLIRCFKFCHAWPPAHHQLTLESATPEEISPDCPLALASNCLGNMLLMQNKSIWKGGFISGKMTLLSHFAGLHPCGISLRSTSSLNTETDIVLAKVFLFPVISKDR